MSESVAQLAETIAVAGADSDGIGCGVRLLEKCCGVELRVQEDVEVRGKWAGRGYKERGVRVGQRTQRFFAAAPRVIDIGHFTAILEWADADIGKWLKLTAWLCAAAC